MRCPECYSEYSRITPLRKPKDCLENHKQYICSVCGRHICISLQGKKRARCFFPFSSLEQAILYLKCAEIITKGSCGIYELKDKKSGRKSYKIFPKVDELKEYLHKNPKKICETMEPIYVSPNYIKIKDNQIKRLNKEEMEKYLEEMEV
ncbi:hypothetical protein [Dethiothermospora halolimnae]|uniref:hypothetical protein n=1 Tax=Dethiothermospora halolimnae TaxID=3114390 RepID=UPI003CCBEE5E